MRLAGRVALVTGGARGIGRAIATGLAREGAAVCVNYATRAGEADRTVAAITDAGGRAFAFGADVSVNAQVEAMVAATVERFGRLDILVNNAADTDSHRPWTSVTEEIWDRSLDVNLKSCFLCFRAAHPHLVAGGHGRVIQISSVTYWTGQKNLLPYVSSKGGMIGFTRTLAREIGPEGITVNAITPGAIRTEAELEMFPDQEQVATDMARLQSLSRRGLPEDIANGVVFLASDEASFITGQTLNIDGGWAMH
ncbi:MAG: 3-oxoacyl-ACP reductase family protein [Chloroflexota bacterium]